MSAETPPFEASEYRVRLEKARTAMDQAGLDLLIVSDPANMGWLTGYDGWSFYVHQCVVVSKEKDPIWFGREMDANGCRRTAYLDADRIKWYPEHYVLSETSHPMTVLARIIAEEGYASSTVGVEKDNYFFSAAAFEALLASLPNAKFKNAYRLIDWQRIIKSPQEIEYMRGAGKIVEAMFQRVSEVIRPGVKQSDLVAEIYHSGTRGVNGYWGDYPSFVPLIGAGVDASAPHLTWSGRPICANDSIFLELAGVHRHYHCPLARTYYLGKPSRKFRDAETAVLEGMNAGLQVAVKGNTCEDIANAYRNALARYGLVKSSRAGYSIGLGYPPDGSEHSASLRSGDKTELRPGMTFHFMSGLWYDDWGVEITESILITEGKAECLANVPRELLVIE
ncbi:M24 family metallopeptidase [Rhizobium leguminosarum]